MQRRYGAEATQEWHDTQVASINHVRALLDHHKIDADTHSQGETCLAHSARAWRALQAEAKEVETCYGVTPQLISKPELAAHGLNGPWFGAMTTPVGFALNPQKYHSGLATIAQDAGATLFQNAQVSDLSETQSGWSLTVQGKTISARRVILATNGYSSENLPDWLKARYLPVQSSVLMTRPLSKEEREQAGWWSSQMSYDSRQLLHYFRLLPDGRFLFGMRGGLRATQGAQNKISRKIHADFNRLFPGWSHVDVTHEWSGLISIMPGLVPFVGEVPNHKGLFAAMGYHGNGVAMSSYCGHMLAQHMIDERPLPKILKQPPSRFPFGRHRRWLLAPAYFAAEMLDL